MKDKALSEGEVKARLAQAEVHFSHYRWDDAIATFEAILAGHPDHPIATQGWANAVEQRSIDEELAGAVEKARAALAGDHFDEALSLLNHAQTRGALSHILKYHSEIDGLRSEAQEGQEWMRRIEAAGREAEALAGRRRFDQALEVLDNVLRPLNARGWQRLGSDLAALRETLWAERDVSDRIQFAQAAYEREDYGLATELAAALHEEFPRRDDVRGGHSRTVTALHERARGAWGRLQERLADVNAALAEDRTDDALALLSSLRSEHPRNPDWQAIALRVHIDRGRAEFARGRAALAEQAYDDAVEAFEAAESAFGTTVEIFPEHPTAGQERTEAEALRYAALSAIEAGRDTAAHRWEASRGGWRASREHLDRAIAARGRDFGEVAAVIDARLGEAEAALADLTHARLMLADGRQALGAADAAAAREAFRAGLARIEGGRLGDAAEVKKLADGLAAGLREAERVQRDVKKLLTQADAAPEGSERLAVLRKAYEKWETAPGLAARLADELLALASAGGKAGDDEAALAYCEQVASLSGAPEGAVSQAAALAAEVRAHRAEQAARDRREVLLARVAEQTAAGRAVEALPLLQAHAAVDPDPAVLAVLEQVKEQSAGDAGQAAQDWRGEAVAALERGELGTAEAYVALAQSYAALVPQEAPQIRRIERQIALLTEVRDRTREARALATAGDVAGALAHYRNALELATDGETGLPQDARRALNRLLDEEDERELSAPVFDNGAQPLVVEFVAPALGGWLRLARRQRLQPLSEQLAALLEQVRGLALEEKFEQALALAKRAEFLDPARRAAALWDELDRLAELIEARRAEKAPAPAPMRQVEQVASEPAAVSPASETLAPAKQHPRVPQPAREPVPTAIEPVTPQPTPVGTRIPDETPETIPAIVSEPVPPAPAPVAPEPFEPPAPFDVDDWLSNVTELDPEE